MSRKKPHLIMGQTVQGTPKQGYSIDVKFYNSTENGSYTPNAQDMLTELENDLNRLDRVINTRARNLSIR